MAPLISIIIPIFNVEKYLQQCLSAIAGQTLTDFETICVNDGATDTSPEIMDTFADQDPRFKVIHKQNAGYGAAVNTGLAKASG